MYGIFNVKYNLPEVFSLLPGVHDFLAFQSLLESLCGASHLTEYIFVMLGFHGGKRLSDKMLLYVTNNACDYRREMSVPK